jgi:acyl-CoA thioesterase FadM
MEEIGHPLPPDMARSDLILPIVHAHSDYHGFLRLGDRVRITVSVEKISTRSYGLTYTFARADGEPCATVHTVHVAVDPALGRAVTLPEPLKAALRNFQAGSGSVSV